jgi:hypothetical protein
MSQNTPEMEALQKSDVLPMLDKIITILSFVKDYIPGKADDVVLSFLQWARQQPELINWLNTEKPTPENAVVAIPEVMTEAFRRWQNETGIQTEKAIDPAVLLQAFQLAMTIFQNIIKRRQGKTNPPADQPTS